MIVHYEPNMVHMPMYIITHTYLKLYTNSFTIILYTDVIMQITLSSNTNTRYIVSHSICSSNYYDGKVIIILYDVMFFLMHTH